MKVVIDAGKGVQINGLNVVLEKALVADITEARSFDEAAGLASAHRLPVDMTQFNHGSTTKEATDVSYSVVDGARIETPITAAPAPAPEPEPAPAPEPEPKPRPATKAAPKKPKAPKKPPVKKK